MSHLSSTFTEYDLAPVPVPLPPRLDLQCVRRPLHPQDDILVALEAVSASTTPSAASTPSAATMPDLSFALSPPSHISDHDVLAAHLIRSNSTSTSVTVASIPVPHPVVRTPPPHPQKPHPAAHHHLSPVSISPHQRVSASSDPLSLTLASRPLKKPRVRKLASVTPSRFCHICARTQKSEKLACANLQSQRKCRKAVCEPCFKELHWDYQRAKNTGTWVCPHCRGICGDVPRARCHIYTKTNEKRKAIRCSLKKCPA